jgi:hypothetical protein
MAYLAVSINSLLAGVRQRIKFQVDVIDDDGNSYAKKDILAWSPVTGISGDVIGYALEIFRYYNGPLTPPWHWSGPDQIYYKSLIHQPPETNWKAECLKLLKNLDIPISDE